MQNHRALREASAGSSESTLYDVHVEGRLPLALNGRFLSTGAALPSQTHVHGVIGDGIFHELKINGGSAACYKRRLAQPHGGVGSRGICNESMFQHADQIFAVSDLALPYAIDHQLTASSVPSWAQSLAQGICAHPKRFPNSDLLHCVTYDVTYPCMRYFSVDSHHRITDSTTVDLKWPMVAHDFAITTNLIAFVAQPLLHDTELGFNSRFPYRWSPNSRARLGLLSRQDLNELQWIDVPSKLITHIANAFEERTGLVIDLTTQTSLEAPPLFERWWIDRRRGRTIADVLAPATCMPRINERLLGRPHQFVYCVSQPTPGAPSNISKWDMVRNRVQQWRLPAGVYADEFLFIEKPGEQREDAGWLAGFVREPATQALRWLLLDAQRVESGPVAEIELPKSPDQGRHGLWVGDSLTPQPVRAAH